MCQLISARHIMTSEIFSLYFFIFVPFVYLCWIKSVESYFGRVSPLPLSVPTYLICLTEAWLSILIWNYNLTLNTRQMLLPCCIKKLSSFWFTVHNISFVLLTTKSQTKIGVSPGLTTLLVLFSGLIIAVVVFFVVVFFGRGSQTRYPERDKIEFTTSS